MNPLAVYEDHLTKRSSRPRYSTSVKPGQASQGLRPWYPLSPDGDGESPWLARRSFFGALCAPRSHEHVQERPAALATVAIESVPP
jgi:hypothetical protein